MIAALAPQVGEIVINANRNIALYERYGYPVIADVLPDYPGPLAGMLTGLHHVRGDIVVRPVRCIVVAAGSGGTAVAGADSGKADVSVAHDGVRLQPLYAVLKRQLTASLAWYLRQGKYKVKDWMREQRLAIADFSDAPQGFRNLNTGKIWRCFSPASWREIRRKAFRFP